MLIKGVRLIDPGSGTDGIRDILIEEGRITRITIPDETVSCAAADTAISGCGAVSGSQGDIREYEQIIDARGLTAAPGLVDPHVHMRDPGQTHKEDLTTGAMAAAGGGYTSVILMGNTIPSVDTEEVLTDILSRGRKTPVNIYSCANVTKGMKGLELTDFQRLKEAGAVLLSDDGKPLVSAGLMRSACNEAARLGMIISLHEEDPVFITDNGIDPGIASQLGLTGSPGQAEISMVKRDIAIARETGAELTIQHISTAETVELIRMARREGLKIHGEATPHHFTLTKESVLTYGSLAKMNPPLRSTEDRKAVIEGIADGTIEMIATDHAPHSLEEKRASVFENGWYRHMQEDAGYAGRVREALRSAPSGITGLESSLGLAVRELVHKEHIPLMKVLECMTSAPADIYGLDAGHIREGAPADLILFDEDEEWTFDHSFSRSWNTPFLGQRLPAKIHMVICGGRICTL